MMKWWYHMMEEKTDIQDWILQCSGWMVEVGVMFDSVGVSGKM